MEGRSHRVERRREDGRDVKREGGREGWGNREEVGGREVGRHYEEGWRKGS